MFISKEKFDVLKAAHDAMVAERKQLTEALALSPEATTQDVLSAIEKAGSEDVQAAEQKVKDAETKLTNAENAVTAVNSSLDELGATVKDAKDTTAKIEAVRAIMAAKPGSTQTNAITQDPDPKTNGEDWKTINELPHNQEADKNKL